MCITFEIPTRLIISFLGPSRSTVLLHKKIGRARNLDTRNNNQSEFLCPEEEHISFVIDFISVWRMSCWRLWGLLRGISLNHRSNHRREEKKNLLLLLFFRWGGRIFDSSGFSNNILGLNWEEQVKVVLPSFLKYLPLNISLSFSLWSWSFFTHWSTVPSKATASVQGYTVTITGRKIEARFRFVFTLRRRQQRRTCLCRWFI